ncbi:alpha/beta fold hydrolase [Pseudobacteriovorax antillogorgiicola]|uniref:Lysophospholipase n=1 Tax=Pseudobacteriovorax antillogorgiicola TaxID=1513793 RepID=A0A1Y6BU33_9BACT|nr:alpha/beta hydrolase [Pseudobacteriovorax antillogorgiicola]TCS52446.1 lysophospholipase [Pseudobacteriovorax antillogorgiicola]SMF28549.1 lysophospholipase [Pseudobacteriovorax antillogorgiicola]
MEALRLTLVWLALIICGTAPAQIIDLSEQEYKDKVRQFEALFASAPVQHFEAQPYQDQAVQLEYKAFRHPEARGSVFIVHGYTGNYYKYQELIYDLYQSSYSVFMFNQRGHGSSYLLKDQSVYVEDFNHYVEDLKTFVETIRPQAKQPLFILGHSVGGAVTTSFLQRYPNLVDGSILSAPMIRIKTTPFPEWLAQIMAKVAELAGLNTFLAPGQELPKDDWNYETANTSSRLRFDYHRSTFFRPDLSKMQRGGVTVGYINAAFQGIREINDDEQIRKMTKPILLLQAELDSWVQNVPQEELCERAPQCELVSIPSSKHEIFLEAESIRNLYLNRILSFLHEQTLI